MKIEGLDILLLRICQKFAVAGDDLQLSPFSQGF